MLPPGISTVVLVAFSASQFATAWRLNLNPQNLDLRSEPSPVRRLLPNANEKLAHVVEEVRSTHISSSTSSSSTEPPPPPPPTETTATIPPGNPGNPSTGELGGGTIPGNPSNVVTSLLCGEAWQAQNGAVSWANYGGIMKVIKAVSISQAEAVWNAKDMNPQKFGEVVKVGGEGEEGGGAGAGKGCTEVGCKGESGVWWCGENDGPVEIDRMFSVLWGANYILEECFPFVNREDGKAMKEMQVAGQVFFAGGWSVIVKGGMCK